MAQSQNHRSPCFYASMGAGGTQLLRRSVGDLIYYRGEGGEGRERLRARRLGGDKCDSDTEGTVAL